MYFFFQAHELLCLTPSFCSFPVLASSGHALQLWHILSLTLHTEELAVGDQYISKSLSEEWRLIHCCNKPSSCQTAYAGFETFACLSVK